jgi:gamma-glutamyltranspeptidase/glutathione hydrolase
MPVMVTDAHGLRFVSATMGGQGQPQIHAQTLLRAMAGASAAQAVAAPRAIVGPQRDGDRPSDIYVEPGLTGDARASLRQTGLHIIETDEADELVGHANLIAVAADGTVDAGSDPRSDGEASVRSYPQGAGR